MSDIPYVCLVCGHGVHYAGIWEHVRDCNAKARAEQARTEQTKNTYYGQALSPEAKMALRTMAGIKERSLELTEKEKRALTEYVKTSPEYIEHYPNGKES